jgi:RNA methyltransferase, TrmH family
MDISSLQNPRVKQIVKLRERRGRDRDGLILVEGDYEIQIAIKSGLLPQTIYLAPEIAGDKSLISVQSEIVTVSRQVFEKISYRENPDGWLAVFPMPHPTLEDVKLPELPFLIIAESIEKPGNLGAILRTADAAGVDALIVSHPRTDIYNPNVVRASRGTVFTVPVVQVSNAETLAWLREKKITIVAASPGGNKTYTEIDLGQPLAIAVGTEDEGLSDFWMDNADEKVRIPMSGSVNSLNVSVSTAIIAYETVRQRRKQNS